MCSLYSLAEHVSRSRPGQRSQDLHQGLSSRRRPEGGLEIHRRSGKLSTDMRQSIYQTALVKLLTDVSAMLSSHYSIVCACRGKLKSGSLDNVVWLAGRIAAVAERASHAAFRNES